MCSFCSPQSPSFERLKVTAAVADFLAVLIVIFSVGEYVSGGIRDKRNAVERVPILFVAA